MKFALSSETNLKKKRSPSVSVASDTEVASTRGEPTGTQLFIAGGFNNVHKKFVVNTSFT